MDDDYRQAGCVRPGRGPRSDYFPNVVLLTHENRRALFYDDLLRSRTVLIHFISTRDEDSRRLAMNLSRTQSYLSGVQGRDVFLYSITRDPLHDHPARLEKFAAECVAQPGWLFLTGAEKAISAVQARLYASSGHIHGSQAAEDCSRGMFRYGNEAVGLWGSAPVGSDPEWIAQRLIWIRSRPEQPTAFVRRGPMLLTPPGPMGGVR
jgi:hypothetical protein